MSTPYEIPLTGESQTFVINLGGNDYRLRLQWNRYAGWMLDIMDSNDNLLVGSIPLVTGIDLLKQHPQLGIPGQLIVETDNDLDAVPTFDNLGTNSHLYFVTNP